MFTSSSSKKYQNTYQSQLPTNSKSKNQPNKVEYDVHFDTCLENIRIYARNKQEEF